MHTRDTTTTTRDPHGDEQLHDEIEEGHAEHSPLDVVATQYADLLWELYWHKKRAAKRRVAAFDEQADLS